MPSVTEASGGLGAFALWNLSGTLSESAGNPTGTVTGSWTRDSQVGTWAIDFEGGKNQHYSVAHNTALDDDLSSGFSISFWLKPEAMTTQDAFLGKSDNGSWNTGWGFDTFGLGGTINFWVDQWNADNIQSTGSIAVGAWTHVLGVWDGDAVKLFVNGEFQGENTGLTWSDHSIGDLEVGRLADISYQFNGIVDDLAIWNTALTGTHATTLYNNGDGVEANTVSVANLIMYHPLNDGPSSVTASDASVNNFSGTLLNMPVGSLSSSLFDLALGGGTERYAATAQGLIGFYSQGGGDLLNSTAPALALTGNMIGHCIVASNEWDSNHIQVLFEFGDPTDAGSPESNIAYGLRIGESDDRGMQTQYIHEYGAGSNAFSVNNRYGLIRGVPYHLGFARIDDEIKFYMNGRPISTSSLLTAVDLGSGVPTSDFRIAGYDSSVNFRGAISDVKLVTGSMTNDFTASDAYFASEYSATIGGHVDYGRLTNALSPVAYYPLNGDMLDYSGNDYHLTRSIGTERYTDLAPGFKGFLFDTVTRLERGSHDAGLAISGSMTIEFVVCLAWSDPTNVPEPVVGFSGGSEAETNNFLYWVAFDGDARYPRFFHEREGGVNDADYTETSICACAGRIQHWVMVRDQDAKTLRFYLNGSASANSGTFTDGAGGGSNSRLSVGYNVAGESTQELAGGIAELKIFDRALTQTEIDAEYARFLNR